MKMPRTVSLLKIKFYNNRSKEGVEILKF